LARKVGQKKTPDQETARGKAKEETAPSSPRHRSKVKKKRA